MKCKKKLKYEQKNTQKSSIPLLSPVSIGDGILYFPARQNRDPIYSKKKDHKFPKSKICQKTYLKSYIVRHGLWK